MKPKVLLTHPLLKEAMEFLAGQVNLELATEEPFLPKAELISKLKDKDGLLCFLSDQIDKEVISQAPNLKIIANCAVGVNNIDINYARSRGILVTNTPDVLTGATAELTLALILATARQIAAADRFCRQGKFKGWQIDLFLGPELSGKTLGIIGFGRIGQAVAKRAQAFNLKIIYYDLNPLSSEKEKELGVEFRPLDLLLPEADIVSIHASLTPESYHLIDREKLGLLKPNAILINVARGPIVDEKALAAALKKRKILAAGLDVYENEPEIEPELLPLENVILLPHIGSATYETRRKMCFLSIQNLLLGLKGEKPPNLVERN
ncbi:MAG: 2-hydroxyacid dehydrogenase [Candidatus Saccharicenans sp.]